MRLMTLILSLVMIAGCIEGQPTSVTPMYYVDDRTELCFARFDRSLTQVPCSAKVMGLINARTVPAQQCEACKHTHNHQHKE